MYKKIVLLFLGIFHGQMFASDLVSFSCKPTKETQDVDAGELNQVAFLFPEGTERMYLSRTFVKRGNSFVPKNIDEFKFDAYEVEFKSSSGSACSFIISDTYFRSLDMSQDLVVGDKGFRISDKATVKVPTSGFKVMSRDSGDVLLNIWDEINRITK